MKKFALAFLFILCSWATGCGKGSPGTIADAPPRIALPECGSTENCIYLYNRYSQKLLSYNVDAKTVEQQSNIVNYIQYEFNEAHNRYFTAGNSLTNGFVILSVDQKEIKELHRLADENNEAVFPLATDGGKHLFIRSYYDTNGMESKRSITQLNSDNTLSDFSNVTGLVSSGVLIGQHLFYTTYEEAINAYSLYALDVTDLSSKPQLVEENLEASEVYALNGRLLVSDHQYIYNDEERFVKQPLNYFDSGSGILIQIYPDSDANLALDAIDTATKQVIGTATNIIDFSIEDHQITVYCQGHIDRIPLKAGGDR
ncbi:hypothetical protein ABU162_13470 [Paenibacillus thiaminolyticus]|uniref:hypothetical protein n=1 Tax=Paenibacillus thiaminolyticus TaxID=49283 RepID=UPI0035A6294C